MRSAETNNKPLFSSMPLQKSLIAVVVLVIALALTAVSVFYTKSYIEKTAIQDFEFASTDLQSKMESRLRAHAQLLRSGAALFTVTDSVTREMWSTYYENLRVAQHLPGTQGFGYTKIIPEERIDEHIQSFREDGFTDYRIFPEGERDIYTSIIYLEPFSDRNLRAFGYDMYSEPVRRKAMAAARDSNFAVLSGKVHLVQETDEDVQAGALMYIPVYRPGMPVNTVEERRSAIKGWVYSPYRINDLTRGILGNWDLPGKNRIHLRIYDSVDISDDSLLFDSQRNENNENDHNNLIISLPLRLNSEEWLMVFSRNSEELSLLNGDLLIVLISGISISLLMFFLALTLIKTSVDAKKILELNRELEKLNTDKDRFISILGHDLRNPFNSILGFLDILTKDFHKLDKQKMERYLNNVYTVSKNTYNLLEDLMEWTKAQSGNLTFEPRLHLLREVYLEVHGSLHAGARAKKISVRYLAGDDTRVFADREMLKTILRNLYSNAIKFTGPGGEIKITAEEATDQVTITVADDGIGIDPSNISKLFDISQPITTRGTANEAGSGLGLTLCKEFIDIHGGKIWVESEAGKGSRFRFSLPFKELMESGRNNSAGTTRVDPVYPTTEDMNIG
jgi:signal transduction histidine kinase